MTTPHDPHPHPLSPVYHSPPPVLSVPFDPRPPEAPDEEPGVDLKGYLNTL